MPFKVLRKGLLAHHESAAHAAAIGESKNMEQHLGCLPKFYHTFVGAAGNNNNAPSSSNGGKTVLVMKSSPNREVFRRDLRNPSESPSSRRPSLDAHYLPALSNRPARRSSLRPGQQQEEKKRNDERGFLDRAFESAFTFDPEEP